MQLLSFVKTYHYIKKKERVLEPMQTQQAHSFT
jgi:hypothetical protein